MNTKRNFVDYYGVSDSLNIGKEATRRSSSAAEAASLAIKVTSEYRGHEIKRIEDPADILFGRFSSNCLPREEVGTISPRSRNLLTIDSGGFPAVALRYGIREKEFAIGYVQSHAYLDTLESFQKLKKDLGGVRPHELLVAHFIARVASVLNEHPETKVIVSPFYTDKPLYPKLRDRFFDKNYSLNPNRERIRQILGEDNSWLDSSAIESRKQPLAYMAGEGREKRKSLLRRLFPRDKILDPSESRENGKGWSELII